MSIRTFLEEDKAEACFSPEEISALAIAFENTLSDLGLADRNDPAVTMVAKRIIKLARHGERNPAQLRKQVVDLFQARSRL
jgi:hypothetical protein